MTSWSVNDVKDFSCSFSTILMDKQSKLAGNKEKRRISKRLFQENKARQIFRKTNSPYSLMRAGTCVYQGIRNVRFSTSNIFSQRICLLFSRSILL